MEKKKEEARPEYRSGWEAELGEIMERILNREPFRYSLNGDALYQQYRDQARQDGRLAMEDTMGMAAALTGGYGNSYAQSVGQQAYQREMASLADRIPELYALAMEQYRQQTDDLMNRYGLLSGREQQDYDRYRDAYTAWQQDAQQTWREYTDQRDFDYRKSRDDTADAQWQQSFDYTAARDKTKDSQWQAEFDEDKRRYDQTWDEKHPAVQQQTYYPAAKAEETKPAEEEKKPKVKGALTKMTTA